MSARRVTDAATHRDGVYPHVGVGWHPLGKGLVNYMKPLELSLEDLRDELLRRRTSVRSR